MVAPSPLVLVDSPSRYRGRRRGSAVTRLVKAGRVRQAHPHGLAVDFHTAANALASRKSVREIGRVGIADAGLHRRSPRRPRTGNARRRAGPGPGSSVSGPAARSQSGVLRRQRQRHHVVRRPARRAAGRWLSAVLRHARKTHQQVAVLRECRADRDAGLLQRQRHRRLQRSSSSSAVPLSRLTCSAGSSPNTFGSATNRTRQDHGEHHQVFPGGIAVHDHVRAPGSGALHACPWAAHHRWCAAAL